MSCLVSTFRRFGTKEVVLFTKCWPKEGDCMVILAIGTLAGIVAIVCLVELVITKDTVWGILALANYMTSLRLLPSF